MLKARGVIIIFILSECAINSGAINYPELKLLSVVFRHGDREPDDSTSGDLTVAGRQRAHHLGEGLRERYGDFLADAPEACEPRSTAYARAKMSLQLVLAGLYAPRGRQMWHPSLAWQPIAFAYAPENADLLLFPKFCPRFARELDQLQSSREYEELLSPYKDMMKELAAVTGEPMITSHHMFLLYHKLAAMSSMNRTLPDWAAGFFPDGLLLNGTYLEYDVLKHTEYMRKINGGALVRKIVDDMMDKATEASNERKKIFLYSTHEMLIVAALQSLKIWKAHIPEYTSSIVLELREDRQNYFVKVLYYLGIPSEFREMQIPGCLTLCPLERFVELIADQLPWHDELICSDE